MRVHPIIVTAFVTAIFSLQGWMIVKISDVELKIVRLETKIEIQLFAQQNKQKNLHETEN